MIGRCNVSFGSNYDGLPTFTYTGEKIFIDDGNKNWRIKFLTSGVFTLLRSKIMIFDVFLVGGGGGGSSTRPYVKGAGGGGGGYTRTEKNIVFEKDIQYSVIIGAGGAADQNGENSSINGIIANGGKAATTAAGDGVRNGGDGGSGGGSGVHGTSRDGHNGGYDGGNTEFNWDGVGQGTTTREFGEPTGDLYAGGGAGGGGYVTSGAQRSGGNGGAGGGGNAQKLSPTTQAQSGAPNTGGGGGGVTGQPNNGGVGGSGGSGIIIIRNHRTVIS